MGSGARSRAQIAPQLINGPSRLITGH
jgi:hypothetical protein